VWTGVSGDRETYTTTTTRGYGRAIVSASEEGGAPWRHVAGGPWLLISRKTDEHVREGNHDTNRLIFVTVLMLARATSLSSFLASPGGER